MFKWQFRLLICILLGARTAGAVEVWTAGGSGFAWSDVGELTGLTTDASVLLPAVVDSTTNAVEILTLKRRGGNISSPQSREDLTGLLTDGTIIQVTRKGCWLHRWQQVVQHRMNPFIRCECTRGITHVLRQLLNARPG